MFVCRLLRVTRMPRAFNSSKNESGSKQASGDMTPLRLTSLRASFCAAIDARMPVIFAVAAEVGDVLEDVRAKKFFRWDCRTAEFSLLRTRQFERRKHTQSLHDLCGPGAAHVDNTYSLADEAINCVRLRVRYVIRLDFTHRLSEAHPLRPGERRHFNEFSCLPKETPATGTEFIKYRIEQAWRRSYRSIRRERDVNLINLMELIGCLSRHQVSNSRRRATTKTNRHSCLPGLSVQLELTRSIKQAAEV